MSTARSNTRLKTTRHPGIFFNPNNARFVVRIAANKDYPMVHRSGIKTMPEAIAIHREAMAQRKIQRLQTSAKPKWEVDVIVTGGQQVTRIYAAVSPGCAASSARNRGDVERIVTIRPHASHL